MERKRPGPAGTSCLTCRRRHKKCDQTRPRCERCEKGGFECLGYDCDEVDTATKRLNYDTAPSWRVRNTNAPQVGTADLSNPCTGAGSLGSTKTSATPRSVEPSTSRGPLLPAQPSRRAEPSYSVSSTYINQPCGVLSLLPPQSNPQQSSSSRIIGLAMSLPPNVSCVASDTSDLVGSFMARFDQMVGRSLFIPTHRQIAQVHDAFAWRVQNIPSVRWIMAMRVRVFDSALDGTSATEVAATIQRSITRIEHQMYLTSVDRLTPAEARNQFIGTLELADFKIRMGYADTYLLLKHYASTFIQIAFSDPSLWPSSCSSTAISLAHVLASQSNELKFYIMLDTLCAMVYGLPQLIEYNTSTPLLNNDVQPAEFNFGFPADLQLVLADLNRLASWNWTIGPAPDWSGAEKRLKEWQSVTVPESNGSWKVRARLAMEESWRHTLLVYLYMAVCGASSDEARVAASVQRVFEAAETVTRSQSRSVDIHFRIQILVAGAFTSNETYRTLVQANLRDGGVKGPRLPFSLDIRRIMPVLEHLWHGAAANGRAIRWDDYMFSRRAVIPVETWL